MENMNLKSIFVGVLGALILFILLITATVSYSQSNNYDDYHWQPDQYSENVDCGDDFYARLSKKKGDPLNKIGSAYDNCVPENLRIIPEEIVYLLSKSDNEVILSHADISQNRILQKVKGQGYMYCILYNNIESNKDYLESSKGFLDITYAIDEKVQKNFLLPYFEIENIQNTEYRHLAVEGFVVKGLNYYLVVGTSVSPYWHFHFLTIDDENNIRSALSSKINTVTDNYKTLTHTQ